MASDVHRIPVSLGDCVINNISIGRQIGRGANGRILGAKWEGAEVAVKEIHSIYMYEVSEPEFQAFKQSFLRECEQSNRLRHPNIVRFFGIYLPPGARLPSLVMERLHCSLNNLLEQTPVIPIGRKLSILYDVSLGIRYLHSRNPLIIHRDLSSNNVLLSKAMEAKIGDLGTARLVDPRRQSQMTNAPGTVDFMPPEALAANPQNVRYGRELDVFSFGCVMLHTLSHQWPTPSEAVVTDPVTFEVKGRTEVQRRSQYFSRIDRSRLGVFIPLIESCLSNIPKNRTSIVTLSEQLEGLVDREHVPNVASLQQDIQRKDVELLRKDAEIQRKDTEIDLLRSNLSQLQLVHPDVLPNEVNKSRTDFWNHFKLTWDQCCNLPMKCWVRSVALCDDKVYVAVGTNIPYVYDSKLDHWSQLPELPYWAFSLATVPGRMEILAIGGKLKKKVTNKVFQFDMSSDKWITPYPNMPTARCCCSSISHGSSVIVAGGKTGWNPTIVTRAVEVLHITDSEMYWIVVEQLPHVTYEAVPLIVNDDLYIAGGFDNNGQDTYNIVTASLSHLLDNSDNTSRGQVWNKLPDMPCTGSSISHYCRRLIVFSGDKLMQKVGDYTRWSFIPFIYIYNDSTMSWDCVDKSPYEYLFGPSIQLKKDKIMFVGGLTGEHNLCDEDDMVPTCMLLSLTPR